MPFSGGEVSEKGFPRGWDAADEALGSRSSDQGSQRIFRVTQLLEAMVFRDFSWDIFASQGLRYSFRGGLFDDGTNAWEQAHPEGGSVTLTDNKLNFIERTERGVVTANTNEFTYVGFIPMAEIRTSGGRIIPSTYIDRRPLLGGAPTGVDVGVVTFPQIIGLILDSQVPSSAVIQFQQLLSIRALQITPGTFGTSVGEDDYTFPSDLGILQDLFVGRDAVITEDLAVLENLNVLGILTAEGVALFEALATFQAAAVFESSVSVEGIATLRDQVRRGIRTITAADTPYTLIGTDWHLNVDISLGSVEVLIPDAAAHFSGGFTDQLHFKIIGSGFGEPFVTLTPSVGGQLVDGFDSAILRRNNLSFTLVSDGTDWWIQ